MNEVLTNMIRYMVGESPRIQVKEIWLFQEVSGDKVLVVALNVETPDGYRELEVETTIDQDILSDANRGISSYFPIVAGAVKEKVSERYDVDTEVG